ncbi:MAG: TrkA family potassium uptake protein [Actinomycetota bacterium]|nr:TrkA family potassium uptake protein [Actinomycetota bacterium]
MFVVIAGGGKVGRYIAADLIERGHEVSVIERQRGRCESLVAEYPVLVIEGDACDVRYLEQARVDRADVFVATTREDDDNLVACQLARTEFGVRRVISRVNSPKNVEIFELMGIEAVSSTTLISRLLEEEVTVGELIHLHTLKAGKVDLVEVRIPDHDDANAPPPRSVEELDLPLDAVLVAIFRGDTGAEETIIPRGSTQILPGDEVIALTTPELEDELRRMLVGRTARR